MVNKDKTKLAKYPTVSICTPTFNRRPFIPIMIKCFEHQTYPKDKIEWLIVDDGTDKIEDMVTKIPQVKYFKFDEKISLGKKRNFLNEKCSGDIIIYMDDDDYYPPERISHAVDMLRQNPKALCAGSSAMYIYFKHINKMYQFGPYGQNHATAATFAFRRELLKQTKFDEESCVAEEKKFLKDYTIPMVQLESKKSILVFSHIHNSFDKKELLKQGPSQNVREVNICPSDMIKESEILHFFMEDIDKLLDTYEPGKPENKPDVVKQLQKMKEDREEKIKEHMRKQFEYNNLLKDSQQLLKNTTQINQNTINEQTLIIQQLTIENQQLKDKIFYLDNKISQLINKAIQDKMTTKISE